MKQLSLPEATEIHINDADFSPRKSGKKKVPSVRLLVTMRVANTMLDQIWPGLRQQMYSAATVDGGEAQNTLEGVDAVSDTPLLRFGNLKPIRTKDELTGYSATIAVGIGRPESAVKLTGCTLDKFEADMKQGGEVGLKFRISSEGLSERDIGRLGMLVDGDAALMLVPPTVQDPLTGLEAEPGKQPANTAADVAEDARHRKAGKESGVSRIGRKVNAAAKKAEAKKAPAKKAARPAAKKAKR